MQYNPNVSNAASLQELRDYINKELGDIAKAFTAVEEPILPTLHKPPNKFVEGQIVLADGSNWDPGAGAGFYGYRGGAWRFLG